MSSPSNSVASNQAQQTGLTGVLQFFFRDNRESAAIATTVALIGYGALAIGSNGYSKWDEFCTVATDRAGQYEQAIATPSRVDDAIARRAQFNVLTLCATPPTMRQKISYNFGHIPSAKDRGWTPNMSDEAMLSFRFPSDGEGKSLPVVTMPKHSSPTNMEPEDE